MSGFTTVSPFLLIINSMENPFLKLAIGIPGDIGKISKAGINAAITHYWFLDCWFHHGPGNLMIARKDQFPDAESAFLVMLERVIYNENATIYTPAYLVQSTEDDFIFDAEDFLLPVYGQAAIKEIPVEKFTTTYKSIISYMTGYYIFENVDQKTQEYVFKTIGIDRNGEEYSGNYLFFDPLLGIAFEKCFSVFENEIYQNKFRKEYFAITKSHYIYLLWLTPSSLSPLF